MNTNHTSTSLLAQWRKDTPACQQIIHFNNAGAALPPQVVTEAILNYIQEESQIGGYETAALHQQQLQQFYAKTAQLLGTTAQHIAWASSATDAYNRALSAIPFVAGDYIITSENDYASNHIAFLQLAREQGVQILCAKEDVKGGVNINHMAGLIRQYRPRLVALTHMPSSNGLIQDVYSIGAVCHKTESWYLVDACQTVGQLPLDVVAMKCDFLSATSRKFLRGPRGGGFLYVSERALTAGLSPKFLDLHSALWTAKDAYQPQDTAKRFELWERNYGIVSGTTAAIAYALDTGLDTIAKRSAHLAQHLRNKLSENTDIQILDKGQQLGAIVTCYIPGTAPEALLHQLRQRKIHTALGWHDYARFDLGRKQVPWVLRLSPHYYNTIEEIEEVAKEIFKIICW